MAKEKFQRANSALRRLSPFSSSRPTLDPALRRSSDDLVGPGSQISMVGKYEGEMFRNEKLHPGQSQHQFVETLLAEEKGDQHLYDGIDAYEKKHQGKVEEFQKAHPEVCLVEVKPEDQSKFFRIQFVAYVEKINKDKENQAYKKYEAECLKKKQTPDKNGFKDFRKENPDQAAATMEEVLASEGIKGSVARDLYEKALEEEVHSKEYMDAVLCVGTQECGGRTWSKRPVIVIGGPSSSGKTTAATRVFKFIAKFIPRLQGADKKNYAVAIDGSDPRKVSQMRKLAIQAATNQGFTGISDIQKYSMEYLNHAKKRIGNLLFNKESKLGIIIPETFVKAGVLILGKVKIFDKIQELGDSVVAIFCRVDGEVKRSVMFENIVNFLGSLRSWFSKFPDTDDEKQALDLNREDAESKPRVESGYKYGQDAADIVEEEFQRRFPGSPCLGALNDAVFIRIKNTSSGKEYEIINDQEPDCIIVSRSSFEAFKLLKNPGVDLKTFDKNEKIYYKKPDPKNPAKYIDAVKSDPEAVEVKVQSWELWSSLNDPKQIGLKEFNEDAMLWKKMDKNGIWQNASEGEPEAIEVTTQTYVLWTESDKKQDLLEYVNNRQKVKPLYEFQIGQLKNDLIIYGQQLKKEREVYKASKTPIPTEIKFRDTICDSLIKEISKTNFADKQALDKLVKFIAMTKKNMKDNNITDKEISKKLNDLDRLIVNHLNLMDKAEKAQKGQKQEEGAVAVAEYHPLDRFIEIEEHLIEMKGAMDKDLLEKINFVFNNYYMGAVLLERDNPNAKAFNDQQVAIIKSVVFNPNVKPEEIIKAIESAQKILDAKLSMQAAHNSGGLSASPLPQSKTLNYDPQAYKVQHHEPVVTPSEIIDEEKTEEFIGPPK